MNKSTFDHFMRKVNRNASGILSVAPMKGRYVWLNEELEVPSRGTISFEAKGHNDICICLHTNSSSVVVGRDGFSEGSPAYEILFGGWSNSKSAIRKHGIQKRVVTKTDKQEAVIRTTNVFSSYWITIYDDWVYAGAGELGCNEILRWRDPQASESIKCIGFSSWNTPLQFKNILVGPPFIPKIHTFDLNGDSLCGDEILSDAILPINSSNIPVHNAILYSWKESFAILPEEVKEEVIDKVCVENSKENFDQNSSTGVETSNHSITITNEQKNPWESLNVLLAKKLLQFMYTGTTGDLSTEQLVQLMNFAMKHSLTTLLEHLQSQTCGEKQSKPAIETIIRTVTRFHRLFRNPLFSDVEIICDGEIETFEKKTFVAHRVILALWSQPFKAMFTSRMRESTQKEIYLPEVNYRDFKVFLEFCYKGEAVIPPQRAIPILMLADRFGVTPLQENCCEVVVKFIDLDNCCELLEMASLYNWAILRAHCMRFIETNFKTVVNHSDEFVEMSSDALLELILSDDLMVSDEFEVYSALVKWSEYQFPLREECSPIEHQILVDLMCCIRFPLLTETFLTEEVSNHYLFQLSQRFRIQIEKTLEYLKCIEDGGAAVNDIDFGLLDNYKKRPRNVYNHHQLLFSHSGDQNGVCYFLGCNYGKNSIWQNPHKARRLTVTLSCPPSRYSRAELLVSRSFSTTNFATGNPPWCMIDFGEGHELVCNHYTLRLDSSQSFLQNWLLQGCNDLSVPDQWVTLRVHQEEPLFVHADWAVFGKSARFPYRYFRVLACPPTTSLGISSIELYGYYK